MTYYYPIPAGATVTCKFCQARISDHLNEMGDWKGCPDVGGGEAEPVPVGYPIWIVTVERRSGERRSGRDRRNGMEALVEGTDGEGVASVMAVPPVFPRPHPAAPVPLVAGPRQAVYVAAPGARIAGNSKGQPAAVFQAIAKAGTAGKTGAELRKELKLKAKSLESVLYRLKLTGAIRAFNLADVRQGG